MREIKFRAWDERNNEMVYSDVSDCFYINTKGVLFMYAIPKSESGLETLYHKSYDVDQFTGLQDKNGVDIYECDIVQVKDYISMEVIFSEGVLAWALISDEAEGVLLGDISSERLTIIGNIYENPELLEDK